MSILTEALEKILSWLQQNKRSFASALQPGLTYTQIQAGIEDLPFDLPEEVYELYHVNAYGILGTMTFPLMFKVFKPQKRLKPEDIYQTKIQRSFSNYPRINNFWF